MDEREGKPRKHLNRTEKRALKAASIRSFVHSYGRKAQKGVEPNDRKYSREFEQHVKQMKPQELDQLIRDDEE